MLPPVAHLVCSLCLVYLVCLVVRFVVCWLNETNQKNQINPITRQTRSTRQAGLVPKRAGHQNPAVLNWFFRSLLVVHISKRCAAI